MIDTEIIVEKRNYKEEVLADGCHGCGTKDFEILEDGALFCKKCLRTYWENGYLQRFPVHIIDPYTNAAINKN
jgi:hypothetical protein